MPGNEEKDMNFTQTARGIVRTIALVMSVAVPLAITISAADARVGGGGSSGSRGSRTYSAPPSTTTAPNAAQPMNRTFTQPGSPGMGAPAAAGAAKGGFFNRPGMMGGMLGGLAMGFLGAGLFGMLTGGGLFSGLGGISSIIGLLLQIGLIIIVVIFMLLEREDLRDRFIRLVGYGDLHRTTQALQDAGKRVGRYLLMQLVVNIVYAIPIAIGLTTTALGTLLPILRDRGMLE